MKIRILKCSHQQLPKYVEFDSQIEDIKSCIFVMESEFSGRRGYYAYKRWIPGNRKIQLSPRICGVSECELNIFFERTISFREFTSSDGICEKYPHMSQDRVREFTLSALKRMHLASQKEEILRQLLEGKTKMELISSGYTSLADIDKYLLSYEQCIDYSCHSEYEKKIVKEAAEFFNKGQVEFLYTSETFAEKFGIPLSLVNEVQTNILNNQSCLTEGETERIRILLNVSDYQVLSSADKEFMQEMCNKIARFYLTEEKKHYCKQVESICQNGAVHERELCELALNNCLDYYKLRKTCQWMRCGIIKKHISLKRVAEFLE